MEPVESECGALVSCCEHGGEPLGAALKEFLE